MTTRLHVMGSAFIMLMLLAGACSRENTGNVTKDAITKHTPQKAVTGMPANDWDMVQIAIAVYSQQKAFNPCPVSKRIEALLERHNTNTTFNMSARGVMWRDFEVSIPETGQLKFDFKADRPVTVAFMKGSVGIRSEEIWIDENTEVHVSGTRYVFHDGHWSK